MADEPREGQPQTDCGAEAGQGLAEYALILAFVALLCIAALGALGQAVASSDGFSLFDLI